MEVDWGSQLFFYEYEGTRLMSIEPTGPTFFPETGMHIDPCGVSKHGPKLVRTLTWHYEIAAAIYFTPWLASVPWSEVRAGVVYI